MGNGEVRQRVVVALSRESIRFFEGVYGGRVSPFSGVNPPLQIVQPRSTSTLSLDYSAYPNPLQAPADAIAGRINKNGLPLSTKDSPKSPATALGTVAPAAPDDAGA